MEVLPLASSRGTSNGPDVTDIAVMFHAIQELHGVVLNLSMSPAGELPDTRLALVAVATKDRRIDGVAVHSVSRKRFFPCGDSSTFEGCIFRLLHEIDRDCGTMWIQERFS